MRNMGRWGAGVNVDAQDASNRMYAREDARVATERFEEFKPSSSGKAVDVKVAGREKA